MTAASAADVAVVLLQTADLEPAELRLVGEPLDRGGDAGERRGDRDPRDHRLRAHLDLVDHRLFAALAGVDDPLDLMVADQVEHVGPPPRDAEVVWLFLVALIIIQSAKYEEDP